MQKSVLEKQGKALRLLLKALRQDKRFTQAELAYRLGKPQSFVAKYESGERGLDVPELIAIAETLGSSPVVLLRTLIKVSQ